MLTRFCNGCTDWGGRERFVEVHGGGGTDGHEGGARGGPCLG